MLVKLITGDKAWSDFVNDAWRKSATLASNFSDVKEDESLSDEKMQGWSVKSPDGGTCCSVRVPREEGVGHPTGTCSVYMSTLIPCPCICAVYGRIRHELFKAHNLPPRWSLENHPLWRDAHRRLKIKLPLATESSNDKAHAAETELVTLKEGPPPPPIELSVARAIFDQIQFPNKSNVRHSRLKQKFDKVANLATNTRESTNISTHYCHKRKFFCETLGLQVLTHSTMRLNLLMRPPQCCRPRPRARESVAGSAMTM